MCPLANWVLAAAGPPPSKLYRLQLNALRAAASPACSWLPPPSSSVSNEGYLPGQVRPGAGCTAVARTEPGIAGTPVARQRQGRLRGCEEGAAAAPGCAPPAHATGSASPNPALPPPYPASPQLYNLSSRYGSKEELRALCADLLRAGIR